MFNQLLQKTAIGLIRVYQYLFSPWLGQCCRFYPSCSNYAIAAIAHYGVMQGGWLMIKRLLRCHPGCQGGYDPLPCDTLTKRDENCGL